MSGKKFKGLPIALVGAEWFPKWIGDKLCHGLPWTIGDDLTEGSVGLVKVQTLSSLGSQMTLVSPGMSLWLGSAQLSTAQHDSVSVF